MTNNAKTNLKEKEKALNDKYLIDINIKENNIQIRKYERQIKSIKLELDILKFDNKLLMQQKKECVVMRL